ncbi:MAG TPA: tRNA uridine-5-carboxymethylaminomethyl(34) synthesis GTPase MnmE, partial [Candidatus Omnitrophota bacterium]|nr:tRNA uridine-5-carboxymethylaminomethyl(34) synthesis GTPase MnmE [Candidatus Omnitrophota bacterium]
MAKIDLNEDTIAAIATPLGEGALGIVRLSGLKAVEIVEKVFRPKNKRPVSSMKSFSLRYGWIVDQEKIVDEVVVALMRSPKSYTREDVVEINSHGGYRALSLILQLLIDNGARLAQPGEFTKRAFLNGRIDLTQAEAVLDVIQAKSDLALKNGLSQLAGAVSERV